MRITGGVFGGRRLQAPRGRRARPTTDRVREAWFAILQGTWDDARVVDLCAGSGALGFEALSRGARTATFVDTDRRSLDVVRANAETLDVRDRIRVHRRDAVAFVTDAAEGAFDVAVADPPYPGEIAERLVAHFRTTPFAAVLALEHAYAYPLAGDDTRRYGDTALTFCYAP